ncbi:MULTISPECIES: type II toxin-antitoxin system RelE/ParE family toxin [unclassified Psychrobacter]|uniref:type II toxin-antitoxin system RelE/ParE family toxin n=1 Tax=unclassified Psychrobacter TaxID=196806 RepID=UPI000B7FF75D|nr:MULTISPECIES: type II toxin-antitoxin system RelE/ParE family toxin [unclassified Psychrobacter]MDE4453998.1 type II toxin-antitoxin system RelE/ParE family toxin [Psychrobacter sp. DAB_AL62B]OXL24808.1 addiction module toxin RelE [Psychrobacter sp. DAB_AL32B]
MTQSLSVVQSHSFKKAVKKLHKNQKADLDAAVRTLMDNPNLGIQKVGDLSSVRIYKFKMLKQLTLLAYQIDDGQLVLTLLMIGTHENFYRDVKLIL